MWTGNGRQRTVPWVKLAWGGRDWPQPHGPGQGGQQTKPVGRGGWRASELVVAGANVHDTKLLEATLEAIVVQWPQPTDEAPQHLCLDKGYDNPTGHQAAAATGIRPTYDALVRRSWIAPARRPSRPDVGWWNEPCRGCPSAVRASPRVSGCLP